MDDYKFKLGLAIVREEELNKKLDALTAYDEAKERELFIAEFKLEGKIHYDENTKQWLPTRDTIKGFQMAERTLGCWIGWSACAKSRARSAE